MDTDFVDKLINEMRWYGKNLSCGSNERADDGKTWREAYNDELDTLIDALQLSRAREIEALQAKIDALMLEFCPPMLKTAAGQERQPSDQGRVNPVRSPQAGTIPTPAAASKTPITDHKHYA